MGGSQDLTPGVNFNLVPGAGRVARVTPSAGSLKGLLPDARTLRTGGPILYVVNGHASISFQVADNGGTALATVNARQAAIVALVSNASINGVWIVYTRTVLAVSAVTPAVAIATSEAVSPGSVRTIVLPSAAIATGTAPDPGSKAWSIGAPGVATSTAVANDPTNVV